MEENTEKKYKIKEGMQNKKTELICILVSVIIMLLGVYSYYQISNFATAILLILEAVLLAKVFQEKYHTFINSCSLFSLIWFATIGLATLRLHQLQEKWKIATFIYLELAYIMFIIGYMLDFKRKIKESKKTNITKSEFKRFIYIFFAIVLGAFILEVIIRRYIPLFSKDMASYHEFSVTGIHYFTVSCCLMLPISYIFIHYFKIEKKEIIPLIIINLICLAIPVLIVSRQLLIMTVVITFLTAIYFNRKKEIKLIACMAVVIVLAWVVLGSFRNQNEAYLKQALKIQEDAILSVNNMQMYMYVTFNFDNFNANVGNIEKYSYGTKSLFPVFALTGLKFIIPGINSNTAIRVIDVYNTYPIVMTPYLDFGAIGIIVYMLIVGIVCRKFDDLSDENPINIIIKILIKYSLIFTFFVSYFSNSTMWFYIIILLIFKRILFYNKVLDTSKIKGEKNNGNSASTDVNI